MFRFKSFSPAKLVTLICVIILLSTGLNSIIEKSVEIDPLIDENNEEIINVIEDQLNDEEVEQDGSRATDPDLTYTLAAIFFLENLTRIQERIYNISDTIETFLEVAEEETDQGIFDIQDFIGQMKEENDDSLVFFDDYIQEQELTREDRLKNLSYLIFSLVDDLEKDFTRWNDSGQDLVNVIDDLTLTSGWEIRKTGIKSDLEDNIDDVQDTFQEFQDYQEVLEKTMIPFLVRPEGAYGDHVVQVLEDARSKLRNIISVIYAATSSPDGITPDLETLSHHRVALDTDVSVRLRNGHRSTAPTSADLEGTVDAVLTTSIKENASSLTLPQLYGWVKEYFDYEPYYGSMKGSETTLLQRAGNDLDQASLLVALLRSRNIHARYVIGAIEITQEQASTWLDVRDGEATMQVFSENGVVAEWSGSNILLEHYWVRAYIEEEWVDLDPSFYLGERNEIVNTTTMEIRERNVTRIMTTSDTDTRETIDLSDLTSLPETPEYEIVGIIDEYSGIPSNERHAIMIRVIDGDDAVVEYSSSAPDLAGKVIAIRFQNTSQTDELGQKYMPWEIPAGMFTYTTSIVVNNKVVATSDTECYGGETYELEVVTSSPGYSLSQSSTLVCGSDTVIVADIGKTVREQSTRMLGTIAHMRDGDFSTYQVETLFSFMGLYFFDQLNEYYDATAEDYLCNWWRPLPAVTILSSKIYMRFGPALLFDTGFSMDFISDPIAVSSLEEQEYPDAAGLLVTIDTGVISGILEGAAFDMVFTSSPGIASTTIDDLATVREMEKVTINSECESCTGTPVGPDILDEMMYPSVFLDQIGLAVDEDLEVTTYMRPIQIEGQFFMTLNLLDENTGELVNIIFYTHSSLGLSSWDKFLLLADAKIDAINRNLNTFIEHRIEDYNDVKKYVKDTADEVKGVIDGALKSVKKAVLDYGDHLFNIMRDLYDAIGENDIIDWVTDIGNWGYILDMLADFMDLFIQDTKECEFILKLEGFSKQALNIKKATKALGITAVILDNVLFIWNSWDAFMALAENVAANSPWGLWVLFHALFTEFFGQFCSTLFAVAALVGITVGTAGATTVLSVAIPIIWNFATYLASTFLCPVFKKSMKVMLKGGFNQETSAKLGRSNYIMRPYFNLDVKESTITKAKNADSGTLNLKLKLSNMGDTSAHNAKIQISIDGERKISGRNIGDPTNHIRSSNAIIGDRPVNKDYSIPIKAKNVKQKVEIWILDGSGGYYPWKDPVMAQIRISFYITCYKDREYDEDPVERKDKKEMRKIEKYPEAEQLSPDDNVILGDRVLNVTDSEFKSNIAVIEGGFASYLQAVLYEQGFKTESLSLVDAQINELENYDMIFVASGGLASYSDSIGTNPIARFMLDEYVKNGGTLVVFSQMYGYHWDVIPGNITAIGYQEDHACLMTSLYMGKYTPVFASQPDTSFDANVDGFFLSYTSDADVLLYREKNNQPCMISYDYGKGMVLASTLYPGFAVTVGQETEDEKILLNDVVLWLKDPNMKNFGLHETVKYDIDADEMDRTYLVISEPDGTVRDVVDFNGTVQVDGLDEAGIYHVDYVGMDNDFLVLKTMRDVSIFAVSGLNESENVLEVEGVDLTVITDRETYLSGIDEITGHVYVFNRMDTEYSATLQAGVVRWRTGDWNAFWNPKKVYFDEEITVPANSFAVFNYTYTPLDNREWRLYARLLDDGKEVALSHREVQLYNSYLLTPNISPTFAKTMQDWKGYYYASGHYQFEKYQNVSVSVHYSKIFRNTFDYTLVSTLEYFNTISGQWEYIGQETNIVTMGIGNGQTFFHFGSMDRIGRYRTTVEVYWWENLITIRSNEMVMVPVAPDIQIESPTMVDFGEEKTFTITLTNKDLLAALEDAILLVKLYSSGSTWQTEIELNIPAGSSMPVNVDIPISDSNFNSYYLSCWTYYRGNSGIFGPQDLKLSSASQSLNNYLYVQSQLDKGSYHIWDDMSLSVHVENNGIFNHDDVFVQVEIPDLGLVHNESVSMSHGTTYDFELKDIDLSSLRYDNISLTRREVIIRYRTGINERTYNTYFYLKPSRLQPALSQTIVRAGEDYQVLVTNHGTEDSLFNITLSHRFGVVERSYRYLAPNETWSYSIHVPVDTTTSTTSISISIWDLTARDSAYYRFTDIDIIGLELDISLDDSQYDVGETIEIFFDNTGGVDVLADFTVILQRGSYWDPELEILIYTEYYTSVKWEMTGLTVAAGSLNTTNISIPENIPTGTHSLYFSGTERNTGKRIHSSMTITITGIEIDVTLDSTTYNASDPVEISLENTGGLDVGFSLTLGLYKEKTWPWGGTYYAYLPAMESSISSDLDKGDTDIIIIDLDSNVPTGNYQLRITITIDGQPITLVSHFPVSILGGDLALSIGPYDFNASQAISIQLENTGGVDSELNITGTLVSTIICDLGNDTISLSKDAKTTIDLIIPRNVPTGQYILEVSVWDNEIDLMKKIIRNVNITGFGFNMELESHQYNASDDIQVGVRNSGGLLSHINYTVSIHRKNPGWYELGYVNTTIDVDSINWSDFTIPPSLTQGSYELVVNITDVETGTLLFQLTANLFILGANLTFEMDGDFDANQVLDLSITNTGNEVTIDVEMELRSLDEEKIVNAITLDLTIPKDSTKITYLDLSSEPESGSYLLLARCIENSTGVTIVDFSYAVEIRGFDIRFQLPELEYDSGDTPQVELFNIGGTDVNLSASTSLRDSRSLSILQQNSTHQIQKEGSDTLRFDIPEAVTTGNYILSITVHDSVTERERTWSIQFTIAGLEMDLDLQLPSTGFTDTPLDTEIFLDPNMSPVDMGLDIGIFSASDDSGSGGWEIHAGTGKVSHVVSDGSNLWFATNAGIFRALNPCQEGEIQWDYYNIMNSNIPSNSFSGSEEWLYPRTIEMVNQQIWFGWSVTEKETKAGLSGGIAIFDINTETWDSLTVEDGYNGGSVTDMAFDGTIVWISTTAYHEEQGRIGKGLQGFNIDDGTWTDYSEENSDLMDNMVSGLVTDGDMLFIWYETESGMSILDLSDETWTFWDSDNSGMATSIIKYATVHQGKLWIGHDPQSGNGGVSIYDLSGETWTVYNTSNSGICSNSIFGIAFDENIDDVVWFLSWSTIQSYNGTQWTTFGYGDPPGGQNIPNGLQTIYVCDGIVYGGGDPKNTELNGVWVYNPPDYSYSDRFEGLPAYQYLDWSGKGGIILVEDELWMTTQSDSGNGILIYDPDTGNHRMIDTDDGLHYNKISVIAYDGSHEVWMSGGWSSYRISIFNITSGNWSYLDKDNSLMEGEEINSMSFHGPEVWITTYETIYIYNRSSETWTRHDPGNTGNFLAGVRIYSLVFHGSSAWFRGIVSGESWIARYDVKNGTWTKFDGSTTDLPEGYEPSCDPVILDGAIWCGFQEGEWPDQNYELGYLDPDANSWIFYTEGAFEAHERIRSIGIDDDILYLNLGRDGIYEIDTVVRSWFLHDDSTGLTINGDTMFMLTGLILFIDTWNSVMAIRYLEEQDRSNALWDQYLDLELNGSGIRNEKIDFAEEGQYSCVVTAYNEFGQPVATDWGDFILSRRTMEMNITSDRSVYRENENIVITVQLTNLAQIGGRFNLTVMDGNDTIFQEAQNISSLEIRIIILNFTTSTSTTITAMVEGLERKLEITIATPEANITLSVPEIVGHDPFNATLSVENNGLLNISLDVDISGVEYQLGVDPGETGIIRHVFVTLDDLVISANVTGDVVINLSRAVVFGESAILIIHNDSIIGEGGGEIPFTVYNTGLLDIEIEIGFSVNPTRNVTVYVPRGGNTTAGVFFNLTRGIHRLNYSCDLFEGQADIMITPRISLEWNNTVIRHENETIELISMITNTGADIFTGTLEIAMDFANVATTLSIDIGGSEAHHLFIDMDLAPEGSYEMNITIYREGEMILSENSSVTVLGPKFSIDDPGELSYDVGKNYTLDLVVTNIGDRVGNVTIMVSITGVFEMSNISMLAPGTSNNFSFDLSLPGDLLGGNYTLVVNLDGEEFTYPVLIQGYDFQVEASLNKDIYLVGESAIFRVNITDNGSPEGTDMSVRVKIDGLELVQEFILSGSQSLQFQIPAGSAGQKKIMYNIILSQGTALYISSIYLNIRASDIALTLDKQVYNIGDTVNITVDPIGTGTLNITAPGFWIQEDISSLTRYSFSIPALRSGSYRIEYRFNDVSYSQSFEVVGYSADILTTDLNKRTFVPGNDILARIVVLSRSDFNGLLKFWIIDPNEFVENGTLNVTLIKGENIIIINHTLQSNTTGTYSIVYGIYAYHENTRIRGERNGGDEDGYQIVLVRGGSTTFDVIGKGIILSLSTGKTNYVKGENTSVTMECIWANSSVIDLYLDNKLVHQWLIQTNEKLKLEVIIPGTMIQGSHTLVARMNENGSTASRSVSFNVIDRPHEMLDGNVDPEDGEPSTGFNFTVTYRDPDGDTPDSVNVIIDGIPHNMTSSSGDPTPEDYLSGVMYTYSIPQLNATNHAYSFSATVNDSRIETGTVSGPLVIEPVTNTAPQLSFGEVTPSTGPITTGFTFSVRYQDSDGDEPSWIKATIDGMEYYLERNEIGTPDYLSGELFEISGISLPRGNYHSFSFDASDGTATATGDTKIHNGPVVVNTIPELMMIEMGLEEESSEGDSFQFTVDYRDFNNDEAVWVRVVVNDTIHELQISDNMEQYPAWTRYQGTIQFPQGNHNYSIEVYDGIDIVSTVTNHLEVEPVLLPEISEMGLSNIVPVDGDSLDIRITLSNTENFPVDSRIRVLVDDEEVSTESITLAGGEIKNITVEWSAVEGTHTITVIVDMNGQTMQQTQEITVAGKPKEEDSNFTMIGGLLFILLLVILAGVYIARRDSSESNGKMPGKSGDQSLSRDVASNSDIDTDLGDITGKVASGDTTSVNTGTGSGKKEKEGVNIGNKTREETGEMEVRVKIDGEAVNDEVKEIKSVNKGDEVIDEGGVKKKVIDDPGENGSDTIGMKSARRSTPVNKPAYMDTLEEVAPEKDVLEEISDSQDGLKYCEHCGIELDGDARFCDDCGIKEL